MYAGEVAYSRGKQWRGRCVHTLVEVRLANHTTSGYSPTNEIRGKKKNILLLFPSR